MALTASLGVGLGLVDVHAVLGEEHGVDVTLQGTLRDVAPGHGLVERGLELGNALVSAWTHEAHELSEVLVLMPV